MSSSREYLDFVLDQLSGLKEITFRQMMGEYIIYYHGKIIGGIYDDRFLVKLTKSAKEKMPDVTMEKPYPGAKEMILVSEIEDRDFLTKLVQAIYDELYGAKSQN